MIEHIPEIVGYMGAVLVGVISKLLWDKLRGLEKRQEAIEARADLLERSHIHKIEELQKQMTDMRADIIKQLTDLRISFSDSFKRMQ